VGDFLGPDEESGQHIAIGTCVFGAGERVGQAGVVVAGVDGVAAGAGDVAEGAQIDGLVLGEHGGAGESVCDDGVVQCQSDDFGDVGADVGQLVRVGEGLDGRAAGVDGAAEQPVSGDVVVDAQELFADALGVGVEDTVADVVAQGADVGDVVVEAFQFQQNPADPL
jgi:hypothetical protein